MMNASNGVKYNCSFCANKFDGALPVRNGTTSATNALEVSKNSGLGN